jgi:hypothetical protein
VIVEPSYRGYRIEVNAIAVDGRFNAEVRLLRLFSRDKPHVETVTCLKLGAEHAERAGYFWARRWVDVHGVTS